MPFDGAKVYYGQANCHLARGDADSTIQFAQKGRAAIERRLSSNIAYCHSFPHAWFLLQLGKRDETLTLHGHISKARRKYYGGQGLPALQSHRAITVLNDGG